MPPLQKPDHALSLSLPSQQAEIIADTDVLVVGGGAAGLGAAVGAANAGSTVILVERYGFLGGNGTAALVNNFMSYSTHHYEPKTTADSNFFPQDHGDGVPIIAGVLQHFVTLLLELNGALPPSLHTGYIVAFDPEVFKIAAETMLDACNVHFLYHAWARGLVTLDGKRGVVFETKSGPKVILARVVIDCTGDGDIAAMAGAPFEVGRAGDHLPQPLSLMFNIVGLDLPRFQQFIKNHLDEWTGVEGLRPMIRQAEMHGSLNMPRDTVLLFGMPHKEELNVNCTRINKVSGLNVFDLTFAEYLGRKQMLQIERFFREFIPGFAESYIIQSGPQVMVRETRRITGEYVMTEEDVLTARHFDDVVARGSYPIDLHSPDGKDTILKRVPPGQAYDIPLRCLIPLRVEDMLVAGRCLSGTHEAQGSYRVQPIAMATGHAAGVCAALAVTRGISPRRVPYQDVQRELLRQGADLRGIQISEEPLVHAKH